MTKETKAWLEQLSIKLANDLKEAK